MTCNFVISAVGGYECSECRFRSLDIIMRDCPGKTFSWESCPHRGEEIDQTKCEMCPGNVHIKIFSCAIFKACSMVTVLPTAACCTLCDVPAKIVP
jgi:hypothetical protein